MVFWVRNSGSEENVQIEELKLLKRLFEGEKEVNSRFEGWWGIDACAGRVASDMTVWG